MANLDYSNCLVVLPSSVSPGLGLYARAAVPRGGFLGRYPGACMSEKTFSALFKVLQQYATSPGGEDNATRMTRLREGWNLRIVPFISVRDKTGQLSYAPADQKLLGTRGSIDWQSLLQTLKDYCFDNLNTGKITVPLVYSQNGHLYVDPNDPKVSLFFVNEPPPAKTFHNLFSAKAQEVKVNIRADCTDGEIRYWSLGMKAGDEGLMTYGIHFARPGYEIHMGVQNGGNKRLLELADPEHVLTEREKKYIRLAEEWDESKIPEKWQFDGLQEKKQWFSEKISKQLIIPPSTAFTVLPDILREPSTSALLMQPKDLYSLFSRRLNKWMLRPGVETVLEFTKGGELLYEVMCCDGKRVFRNNFVGAVPYLWDQSRIDPQRDLRDSMNIAYAEKKLAAIFEQDPYARFQVVTDPEANGQLHHPVREILEWKLGEVDIRQRDDLQWMANVASARLYYLDSEGANKPIAFTRGSDPTLVRVRDPLPVSFAIFTVLYNGMRRLLPYDCE